MPLPTVVQPYPLGPYSLETPSGRYWFNGSFKASHLIPGRAQENIEAGEDTEVWLALGDGERTPEVLTLSGDLLTFNTLAGLFEDARTLRRAVQSATVLYRNTGSTHREITIDAGDVDILPGNSPYHLRARVVLYPTTGAVASDIAASPPALGNIIDHNDENILDHNDKPILSVA